MTNDRPGTQASRLQTDRPRHGFTLWELLAVLFIVALLLAALFPSYQYARETVWKLYCLNNLREMVYAAHRYAYDHDGGLPPAYERDFTTRKTVTWETFLWGSNFQQRVQQCPVFKGASMWQGDAFTGYNYNSSYLGGTSFTRNGLPMAGSTKSARLFDIKDPAGCAMFGDGEYESGANKFMRSPFPGDLDADASLALGGTQGFRHRGCTNVGFADGHVESLNARHTETAAYGRPAARCGFLSPDNSLYDLE
jgi:prepilin-type N-terminal cleavage/methylation domain-containing protein/prepilin-type processing-associated H-X9-DG protein